VISPKTGVKTPTGPAPDGFAGSVRFEYPVAQLVIAEFVILAFGCVFRFKQRRRHGRYGADLPSAFLRFILTILCAGVPHDVSVLAGLKVCGPCETMLKNLTMSELLTSIAAKKKQLDDLRPLSPRALANLDHYYDLELTYTSNAIEGNTLTRLETSTVIEKGITVSGKPLKDHLEAVDHYDAVHYMRELARQPMPLTEGDVRNLHKLVLRRSEPEIAGRYADAVRVTPTETGMHTFPSPAEVPALMGDFAGWLRTAPNTPEAAFTAHRRLVAIHPFNDGNGRTARLLMNLILIRGGYPPVAVRPDDRLEYIRGLAEEQAGGSAARFNALLYRRLEATLGEYSSALQQAQPPDAKPPKSRTEPQP
jgi:Fic family protein